MDILTRLKTWIGWNTVPATFFPTPFAGATPFVSPANILGQTPVYRAVTVISNDLAKTPVEFMNPDLERIWNRPNKWQSGWDFRRSLTQQALLYGNSFAIINRRQNGTIY